MEKLVAPSISYFHRPPHIFFCMELHLLECVRHIFHRSAFTFHVIFYTDTWACISLSKASCSSTTTITAIKRVLLAIDIVT